jgi:hypothetical protein
MREGECSYPFFRNQLNQYKELIVIGWFLDGAKSVSSAQFMFLSARVCSSKCSVQKFYERICLISIPSDQFPARRISCFFQHNLHFPKHRWCLKDLRLDPFAFLPNMMSVGYWWNDNEKRKPKYSERSLPQSHFVHHKFHMLGWDRIRASPVRCHRSWAITRFPVNIGGNTFLPSVLPFSKEHYFERLAGFVHLFC